MIRVAKLATARNASIICLSAFFAVFWLNLPWLSRRARDYAASKTSIQPSSNLLANATLGVQRIFAISSEDTSDPASWRQKGLVAAANRTAISLEIVSTGNFEGWELEDLHAQSKGQSQAWAAHLRVLHKINDEHITTAMIMEDDTDWDLDIKKLLAPSGKIAESIRKLSKSESDPFLDISTWPYGNQFDVLWLGHCNGRISDSQPNITFSDDSVLPANELYVWDRQPFVGAPNGLRGVRLKGGVVCTFAYIVTRSSAAQILERRRNREPGFDVDLNNGCGGDLRCLTVQPELFHQQSMMGGRGSLVGAANNRPSVETGKGRPLTLNIRYSARCNANHDDADRVQCLPAPGEHV